MFQSSLQLPAGLFPCSLGITRHGDGVAVNYPC